MGQHPDFSETYLPALLAGDLARLTGGFAGQPDVNEPLAGHITGTEAFKRFAGERQAWLVDRAARLTPLRTTHSNRRSVSEALLYLTDSGRTFELPIAVVADRVGADLVGDGQASALRVYHSLWPLHGAHKVRAPLLPADPAAHVVGVVAEYQNALAAGEADAITATFEADGYFREPAGGEWIYRGRDKVREFMGHLFGSGGIALEHCTVTDDGVACALEFNAVRLGVHRLTPQAGLAVYERGASGRLHAARIYDDVNVEALAGPA